MTRHVAFLGGINVGGHRVAMDRLRREFEALGFDDVRTFIASGNVVFDASADAPSLEPDIEAHLGAVLGYAVPTFVRGAEHVVRLAARPAFTDLGDHDNYYVAFLRRPPTAAARRATEALGTKADRFVVRGSELHWRVHGGMTDSMVKSTVLAKALGQPSTTRNTTSLRKLARTLLD